MNKVELLMATAEAGSPEAQEELGQRYLAADGVNASLPQAVFWLRRAAMQGHENAQLQLGVLCAEGYAEAQADDQVAKWLRVASSNAHELAAGYLSTFYSDPANEGRSVSDLVREWHALALGGDQAAQGRLASIYRYGFGVVEDRDQAARWYRERAASGSAAGKYSLGEFLVGLGTPEDTAEGIRYFEDAALQGNAHASYALGMLFAVRDEDDPYTEDQRGRGVEPDNVSSARWFRHAAKHDHDEAKVSLFFLMRKGAVSPIDDLEEADWTIAASKSSSEAQAHLASLYESGRGVARDANKAAQMRMRSTYPHHRPIRLAEGPDGGSAF